MTTQPRGALNSSRALLLLFSLQLYIIYGSNDHSSQLLSLEPFWKTHIPGISTYSEGHIHCNDTYDAATEEKILSSFVFPDLKVDVLKFHTVYTIPNGSISLEAPTPSYQHVFSANMTPIDERTGHWHLHPGKTSILHSKPIQHLYGDVVFLQTFCQYYHFQHETITQLIMLQESGELMRILANKSNSTLLIGSPLDCGFPDLFGSMLTYYGFEDLLSKLVVHQINPKVTYQVVGGDLVMTGNSAYHPDLHFLPYAAKLAAKSRPLLQQRDAAARGTSESPPPSRLYIDREANYTRGIINRGELLAGLAAYNFTLFSPAKHTFTEQREAFARASLILSPSGTAFSGGIIHCDPDTTVLIEMFGKPHHTRTGVMIAAVMGARHYYAVQPSYNLNSATGDFYVNVSMVVKVIERALHEQQLNITRMARKDFYI